MAVNVALSPWLGPQFLSSTGAVLSGGKVYFYAANTSTPKNTYTAADGATANANPLILDSDGRPPTGLYLMTNGLYDVSIYTSADVLVKSMEDVGTAAAATFTATLDAITTVVTGTAYYTKGIDGIVVLEIPSMFGTSNDTVCTVSGVPALLRPSRVQKFTIDEVRDNGNSYTGVALIQTDGTIIYRFRSSLTSAPSAAFTASGSKGVCRHTIVYSLQ